MELSRITDLTIRHLTKEITLAEQAELDEWLDQSPVNRERFAQRVEEQRLAQSLVIFEDGNDLKESMRAQIVWEQQPVRKLRPLWRRVAMAAIFIPLAGICLLVLWLYKGRRVTAPQQAIAIHDLLPGGSKAVLTLADGTAVLLDSAKSGLITTQGRSQVVKVAAGQLIYKNGTVNSTTGYNMITTPRGGEYSVVLPDGTQVWLNAQSSIRFPTAFSGSSREVQMTGEAYFNVAKNKDMPFRVNVAGAIVQDLGTEFNVMAYSDESAVKTTLISGAARVIKDAVSVRLSPGQQVQVTSSLGSVTNVNTSEVVAWKNGYLEFNGADIETVMRAISRWYDVDIKYDARRNVHTFTGQIDKTGRASEAMQILSTSGYNFRIEGKLITVLP